jgi:hypothetical protein
MEVDRNAESDPIFQKDVDLEYDPRKSDRSEAWNWYSNGKACNCTGHNQDKLNTLFHK